ncbi:MAG: NHLP bacteriocin export ABC transporter permease/ATPase subunit [Oscillospiraceae bacterium]|nr:NHLP bacteriocin export ABC transporter permease/ATPase subunit [Oscillospiraceae bacterium]
MSMLKMKDNVPFWIHEENRALIVKEGIINIYHCKMTRDGEPVGIRSFLFQINDGELILPVMPYSREDGFSAAMLAVPMRDSVLEEARDTDSTAILAEEWVKKCCQYLEFNRDKIEEVCNELKSGNIREFHSSFMLLADERVGEEKQRTYDANRQRYTGENAYLQGALDALQSVVPGVNAADSISDSAKTDDAFIQACSAVAQANGMKITVPKSIYNNQHSSGPIDSISQASRFRTREVILSDKWYRQDGGNFLAKLDETDEPVALLQKAPKRYVIYNPATGERVKVTKENADVINPKATMFYRSLPMHSLTGKDVIRFVMRGTRKADWIWMLVMGLGGGLLAMLLPEITGRVFDTVIPDGNRAMLIQIGFLIAAIALTTFAFELTRAFALQRISGQSDLQAAVWDRLLSLPVSFFKKYTAGELTQNAMSISQIEQVLSGPIVNTIITSIFSVFYIVVMFTKSAKLTWIVLAISGITLLISLGFGYLQSKHEEKLLKINNKTAGKMFGWLSGLAKIKMSGSEKRTFYNWSQMFKESRAITFKKESMGNWSIVWNSVVVLISAIILYAVIFNVPGDERISAGTFIAFNAAFGSLMGAVIQFSGAVMSINVVGPLYKKAKPIFEAVPEYDEQKAEAAPLSGEIELSHVNFSYDPEGPRIIKDVSLHVKGGEHIALVGPSGSGKSTLFRILLAFEKPDSGEIYFDGVSLSQTDIRSVRRQLGVVLQSGQLLAGTIFENIAGSNPNITQKQALEAVKQAGLEEDLKQMPMGLHTVVAEGAGTLSGGQRQRLLIARALVGNPKLLFLDEATSALDNKTQKIVIDSINQLKVTRITIAHRLSTIQDCDRIIVLESGKITEEGTYKELMDKNGTFAAMAKRQIV